MSMPNEQYQAALDEIENLREARSRLMRRAEAEWADHWHAAWHDRYGRTPTGRPRKNANPNTADFPPGELEGMMQAYRDRYAPQVDELAKRRDEADKRLYDLAHAVAFAPQDYFCLVATADSYTYMSQGFGAVSYARLELKPYEAKLRQLGFTVVVRERDHGVAPGNRMNGGWSLAYGKYELWADCSPLMAHAAKRLVTVGEAIAIARREGMNECVMLTG